MKPLIGRWKWTGQRLLVLAFLPAACAGDSPIAIVVNRDGSISYPDAAEIEIVGPAPEPWSLAVIGGDE